jgi:hypothetical protein
MFALLVKAMVVDVDKEQPLTEIEEERLKFEALVMLSQFSRDSKKVIIPSRDEWVGLNLLERDDELKRFRHEPQHKDKKDANPEGN